MITSKVHHLSYSVSDLERSQRFYEDVLGFEQIARPDLGLPGAWYSAGNVEVHLIAAPEGADLGTRPSAITPLANHQAFEIEDYEKTRQWLDGLGVEVMGTSPERGQMWIRDPDGNVIELIAVADAK